MEFHAPVRYFGDDAFGHPCQIIRDVLRKIRTELKGESMKFVLALCLAGVLRQADLPSQSRGSLQVLRVGHAAFARGLSPLPVRGHRARGILGHGHARQTGARPKPLSSPAKASRSRWGTLDTFVTYGAPANLIDGQHHRLADLCPSAGVRTAGLSRSARNLDPADQQAALPSGAADEQHVSDGERFLGGDGRSCGIRTSPPMRSISPHRAEPDRTCE